MKKLFLFCFLMVSVQVSAHQFTPTYPQLSLSHIEGVYKTEMVLFNNRNDIEYYGLDVFDKNWDPVRFASENKVVPLSYQERKYVNIYIREMDVSSALYICSKSKILKNVKDPSIVASRICSKLK
jgi:hypothetical protein